MTKSSINNLKKNQQQCIFMTNDLTREQDTFHVGIFWMTDFYHRFEQFWIKIVLQESHISLCLWTKQLTLCVLGGHTAIQLPPSPDGV